MTERALPSSADINLTRLARSRLAAAKHIFPLRFFRPSTDVLARCAALGVGRVLAAIGARKIVSPGAV